VGAGSVFTLVTWALESSMAQTDGWHRQTLPIISIIIMMLRLLAYDQNKNENYSASCVINNDIALVKDKIFKKFKLLKVYKR